MGSGLQESERTGSRLPMIGVGASKRLSRDEMKTGVKLEPFMVDEIQFWDTNEPASQIQSRKQSADPLEMRQLEDETGSINRLSTKNDSQK